MIGVRFAHGYHCPLIQCTARDNSAHEKTPQHLLDKGFKEPSILHELCQWLHHKGIWYLEECCPLKYYVILSVKSLKKVHIGRSVFLTLILNGKMYSFFAYATKDAFVINLWYVSNISNVVHFRSGIVIWLVVNYISFRDIHVSEYFHELSSYFSALTFWLLTHCHRNSLLQHMFVISARYSSNGSSCVPIFSGREATTQSQPIVLIYCVTANEWPDLEAIMSVKVVA